MDSDAPGDRALAQLDAILQGAPATDSTRFSACTKSLAELRDRMIADHRASPPDNAARQKLAHVNAVISMVMAGHFPLGPVPWAELRKARTWLAGVTNLEAQ